MFVLITTRMILPNNWQRTRYEQGYDATQPESQVDPETGEFQESQKPEDKPEA